MIGRIQQVKLRELWKHETCFTQWLQDNIDVLNEVLDTTLSNVECEQSAGSFSVDLVAEDKAGNPVIIENQLEKSDHTHLGQLITYLTAIGAKAAIWIVADPRPEHIAAISWLNESSSASFYLLKVEAIRIGDSEPAPLLTLIVGPSEEGRKMGEKKKELSERHLLRHQFWAQLLERAKQKTRLHSNISPSYDNWIATTMGKGFFLSYVARQHEANVELYIDRGKDSYDANKAIFDKLLKAKENIETAFGELLEWERLDERQACRIKKTVKLGGYRDEDKWPDIHEHMIDSMTRLEKALKKHIGKLPG